MRNALPGNFLDFVRRVRCRRAQVVASMMMALADGAHGWRDGWAGGAAMKIAATIHVNGLLDEQADPGRFQRETAALERLSNPEVDALCSVLGAGDASELVPKLYRLAAVSLQPEAFAVEMLARDPGALVTFVFELVSYRLFIDRLLAGGGSPREMADAIEREQRGWLSSLIARFRLPSQLLPDTGEELQ
jgi:hypothetical protein